MVGKRAQSLAASTAESAIQRRLTRLGQSFFLLLFLLSPLLLGFASVAGSSFALLLLRNPADAFSSRVWFVHLFPLELVGAFVGIVSLHLTEGLAAYRADVWLFPWAKYERAVDENVSKNRCSSSSMRLSSSTSPSSFEHHSIFTGVGVSMFVQEILHPKSLSTNIAGDERIIERMNVARELKNESRWGRII